MHGHTFRPLIKRHHKYQRWNTKTRRRRKHSSMWNSGLFPILHKNRLCWKHPSFYSTVHLQIIFFPDYIDNTVFEGTERIGELAKMKEFFECTKGRNNKLWQPYRSFPYPDPHGYILKWLPSTEKIYKIIFKKPDPPPFRLFWNLLSCVLFPITNIIESRFVNIQPLGRTVSRDFRRLVFFMNQFPPSPWIYH